MQHSTLTTLVTTSTTTQLTYSFMVALRDKMLVWLTPWPGRGNPTRMSLKLKVWIRKFINPKVVILRILTQIIAETRAKSEKLRSEVEHQLASSAGTMLSAWNGTNQSFTTRIGECSEAHSKIQSQYSMTLQVDIYNIVQGTSFTFIRKSMIWEDTLPTLNLL